MQIFKGIILLLSLLTLFFSASALPKDTLYVQNELREVEGLVYSNPKLAKEIAEEVLHYAEKEEFPWAKALANSTLGIVHLHLQEPAKSQKYSRAALKLAKALALPRIELNALNNIGVAYSQLKKYDEALKFYLKALEIEEETNPDDLGTSYLNIATVFSKAERLDKAKIYLHKARYAPANHPKLVELHVFLNYAILWQKSSELTKALQYADSAKAIGVALNSKEAQVNVGNLKADVYLTKESYDSALFEVNASLQLLPAGNPKTLTLLNKKASALFHLTKYRDAEAVLQKVLAETGTSQNLETRRQALFWSYRTAKAQKKVQEALDFHLAYSATKDTLAMRQKEQELNRLLVQFEVEKNEEKIKALEQENTINALRIERTQFFAAGIIVVAGLLLSALYFFFRQKRLLQQQEILQTRLRWRRAQLDPHFFFNALMSVKILIREGKAKFARSSINQLARLMRRVLEGSNQERISLADEVLFLEDYLNLQQLRFDFSYEISIHPELSQEEIQIPAMLLQPFVENAVEHGLWVSKSEDKQLSITFVEASRSQLQVLITDNGVGRTAAAANKADEQHVSRALEITKDRQKLMQGQFSFSVKDGQTTSGESCGTVVEFLIKI